ncbi:MAG: translation initiation factor [Verrucomicrobiia bacterium]
MGKGKEKGKLDLGGVPAPMQDPFAMLAGLDLPEGGDLGLPETKGSGERVTVGKRGRVVLRREVAGRGGKTVVVAGDFPEGVGGAEIEEMARSLRRALGCGGTVRGREIEVQGERVAEVRGWLEKAGFRVAGP